MLREGNDATYEKTKKKTRRTRINKKKSKGKARLQALRSGSLSLSIRLRQYERVCQWSVTMLHHDTVNQEFKLNFFSFFITCILFWIHASVWVSGRYIFMLCGAALQFSSEIK